MSTLSKEQNVWFIPELWVITDQLKVLILEKKVNTNNVPILEKDSCRKIVYDLTPFTLLDYPDKTACIIWFAGCNMRCTYCYNPEIVFGKGKLTLPHILEFLYNRRNLLDAVVLSGGECLIYPEIRDVIRCIKEVGYLIKIDTNGSKPDVLLDVLNQKQIDYVALDFKAPYSKFFYITKTIFYIDFLRSLDNLLDANLPFEVRTTYHSDQLNSTDIYEMVEVLQSSGYRGNYYIQAFKNGVNTIGDLHASTIDSDLTRLSTSNINIVLRH